MATVADSPTLDAPDFWSVLASRAGRHSGRLFKRGAGTYLDSLPGEPATDRSAMSATFCISKPIPDREDDVIIPTGVLFDDYRLNPVVFWDHGFTSLTLPIGASEDKSGKLAVNVSPEGIDATCFFSQTLLEAEQLFQLVEEGIVRAASIHVDPIDAVVRVRHGAGDRPGLLVHTSNMIEWSLCGVGCNPEAVRKALSADRLAGKPIAESLAKSLRAHAAPTPVVGKGWSPPPQPSPSTEPSPMAKSLKKDDEKPEDAIKRLRKEMADLTGDDDETKSKRKSLDDEIKSLKKSAGMSEGDDDIPADPGGASKSDDPAASAPPDGETPLGSQILGAAYNALSEVTDQIEQASKPLENPQVKDYMGSMTDALRGHMSEMNDLHKGEYPDHPELAKEDAGSDGDMPDADAAESVVKFLARSKTHRMGVKGIAHELLKLGTSRHMPKQYRDKLAAFSRRLSGLSKSADAGAVTAQATDDQKQFEGLLKEVAVLKAALKEAMPYRQS